MEERRSRWTLWKRGSASGQKRLFLEKVTRQIRRGGRNSLIVTLDVPDLKEKRLTVAATHLESNASPESRRKEMEELLVLLQDIHNPVIVAGDLNTTGGNSSPTSIKKQINQRLGSASFWTNTGIKYATGFGLLYDVARGSLNTFKNQDDPTARNIPLVGANPEAELFSVLEDFRFQDGCAFDFRGNKERTINGTEGTLANSNQRDLKGFATTFEFERDLGVVGKLKLDWILVKAYLRILVTTMALSLCAPLRQDPWIDQLLVADASFRSRSISVDLPFEEPVPSRDSKEDD